MNDTSESPAAAGVPLSDPAAERVSPPGNPEAAHVNEPEPPFALSDCGPYVLPTMPLGSEVVVMESWPKMVMDNEALAGGETPSDACTVNVNVPAALGLPVRTPFDPSPIPWGSDPGAALQEYGPPFPPFAARVAEYGAPAAPFGRLDVVTVTGLNTVKLCVTGSAAAKLSLPLWSAVMEHVPAAKTDTRLAVTEQIAGVPEEKVTANPELAVALIVKGWTPKVTVPGELNEMVCGFCCGGAGAVTSKLREALAGAKFAFPPCDATMVQVPAAIAVALVPETVQIDVVLLSNVTVRLDDAVALRSTWAPT